jgi:formylglycine-generating enzyme required for sulfatase activity
MTSRLFLAAVPTAIYALAVVAGTSCQSGSVEYPGLDSGLGAMVASTTTTSSTSTGGSASSSGTGGTVTTTTTTTNSCEGLKSCVGASDCPALGTTCLVAVCDSGCCAVTKAAGDTKCSDNGGKICDGNGTCVQCLIATQCPASTSQCATASCTAGTCGTTNNPKGSSCTVGGTACDGNGNCVNASCTDGIKDGQETDVDCGGPTCSPCADGKGCVLGTDCLDKVCGASLTCSAPTCSDGHQNGNETDVDCGGAGYMGAAACPKCSNNQKCKLSSDCSSLNCQNGVCTASSCSDGILDGQETDVDCGGPNCGPCSDGKHCKLSTDCTDKVCSGTPLTCVAPTCVDGVQNGDETDIDCGGGSYMGLAACPPCRPGQKCDVPGDCAGGNCAGTCQCPTGMQVTPIQGGGIYCIDSIEVTNASYNVFFSANPTTATQDPWCSWNVGWVPSGGWPYPTNNGNYPVSYVNWCQAAAYCKYLGRRLCGSIGGGSVAQSSANDYHTDQWYNACTANGANCSPSPGGCYPYGTTYSPTLCDGHDSIVGGSTGPEAFTSLNNCQGGTVGLLNMSGNVAEWEDSCTGKTGAGDACAVRGGSFASDEAGLRCDAVQTIGIDPNVDAGTITRSYSYADVGFRCCL